MRPARTRVGPFNRRLEEVLGGTGLWFPGGLGDQRVDRGFGVNGIGITMADLIVEDIERGGDLLDSNDIEVVRTTVQIPAENGRGREPVALSAVGTADGSSRTTRWSPASRSLRSVIQPATTGDSLRMRRTVLVFGSVLSLALAACGGGGSGEPADESPADQTVEQTTSDGQTSSDEAEGTPDDDVQAMGQPEEPAKVTYEMTGAGSDGDEQLTLAWDPPRFAMLFADGKMIFDDEGTVFCDASGEGCFRMSSGQNAQQMGAGMGPFFGFTNAWQEGAEELPGATRTSETEIAGRTAVCATYDASEYDSSMQGEAEYCYDPDTGLLLRWSGTDAEGNTQTVTAVEVGDPEASDFEPTGPVQEMPGGGGG